MILGKKIKVFISVSNSKTNCSLIMKKTLAMVSNKPICKSSMSFVAFCHCYYKKNFQLKKKTEN